VFGYQATAQIPLILTQHKRIHYFSHKQKSEILPAFGDKMFPEQTLDFMAITFDPSEIGKLF